MDSEMIKSLQNDYMQYGISLANDGVRKTLMNLEKLACSEKEMIQLQRKTIYVQ